MESPPGRSYGQCSDMPSERLARHAEEIRFRSRPGELQRRQWTTTSNLLMMCEGHRGLPDCFDTHGALGGRVVAELGIVLGPGQEHVPAVVHELCALP